MVKKLLIVPLGYGWAKDLRGVAFADAQGERRIKAAVDYGISEAFKNKDVLFGAFPNVIPIAKGGDGTLKLGDAMSNTFVKYGIPREQVLRGNSSVWGTYGEVSEGLRIGEEMHREVVFVTSSYHVPRLTLVCVEILGLRTMKRKMLWNMLEILGCGNSHATTYDKLTEPVKYIAQLLRIPLGSFLPKTLNGRL